MKRICIIGCGISGGSLVHFLQKKFPLIPIKIFEKNSELGGRTSYLEIENKKIEIGAQFFNGKNYNILNFISEYKIGFEKIEKEKERTLIFNGEKCVFDSLDKFSKISYILRYGFKNIIYLNSLIKNKKETFDLLYNKIDLDNSNEKGYKNAEEFIKHINFEDLVTTKSSDYFLKTPKKKTIFQKTTKFLQSNNSYNLLSKKITETLIKKEITLKKTPKKTAKMNLQKKLEKILIKKKFDKIYINEFMRGVLKYIYNQEIKEINAMATLIGMIGMVEEAFKFSGGGSNLVKAMVEGRQGVEIVKSCVFGVAKVEGGFEVRGEFGKEFFDLIVLAAPFNTAGIVLDGFEGGQNGSGICEKDLDFGTNGVMSSINENIIYKKHLDLEKIGVINTINENGIDKKDLDLEKIGSLNTINEKELENNNMLSNIEKLKNCEDYKPVFVYIIKGNLNEEFFKIKETEKMSILLTEEMETKIEGLGCIVQKFKSGNKFIYAIESSKEIEEENFSKIFSNFEILKKHFWEGAYPILNPVNLNDLPDFRICNGFYYVNSMEYLASCMEMESVSSQNIVKLIMENELKDFND